MEWKGWQRVGAYLGENPHNPLFVSDLSHIPKVAVQSRHLDGMRLQERPIPSRPGDVAIEKGLVIARLTPSECRLMALGEAEIPQHGPECTDMTDAFAALAVVGPRCLEVMSKLSAVDLEKPGNIPPCAAMAPVGEVHSLCIYMKGRRGIPGLIVCVARGYGQYLYRAVTDAGKEWDMTPAGWQRFRAWLP